MIGNTKFDILHFVVFFADDTFSEVFRDFSNMASSAPERLKRSK